jgi:uncharacterized membrane protein YecN with MAPEG domain
MNTLPMTSLFVAFFVLFLVALSLPVTFRRIKVNAPMGDGADETLRRSVRAQGNFVEYVPIGMIALGLVEAHGAPVTVVIGLGGALALGRVAHAAGILTAAAPLRVGGMALTFVSLVGTALRLIGVV